MNSLRSLDDTVAITEFVNGALTVLRQARTCSSLAFTLARSLANALNSGSRAQRPNMQALDRLMQEPKHEPNNRGGLRPWWGPDDLQVIREATTWLLDVGGPQMELLHQELPFRGAELHRLREALQVSAEQALQYVEGSTPALRRATDSFEYSDRSSVIQVTPAIAWVVIIAYTLDIWS